MDFSESASHVSRAIALSAIIICFFFPGAGGNTGTRRPWAGTDHAQLKIIIDTAM
jgi:hypothetical protein